MKNLLTAAAVVLAIVSCAGGSEASVENLKPFEADGMYTIPVKDVSLTLRKIDGSFFLMGETFDLGVVRNPTIVPAFLDGYAIGTEEVSKDLWAAVMGGEGGKGPKAGVTWADADKFIQKLSRLTGIPFRLPTEAEWEYAARKDASMPGSLWEWCQDPQDDGSRPLRGGCQGEKICKPNTRKTLETHTKSPSAGLRIAVSTGEAAPAFWKEILKDNIVPREVSDGKQETISVNGVSFKMIPVKGGTFRMGATAEVNLKSASDDEFPVHDVTLDDFKIGQTEVSCDLWKAVMGTLPPLLQGGTYPVGNISWYDAQLFIQELNRLTGRKFRLPTEAEWEYAAKGGAKSRGYCFAGSNSSVETTWCELGDNKTRPSGGKFPNELGIFDMTGNAWEWVQDRPGPYTEEAQTNPTGPLEAAAGDVRSMRGGSVSAKWTACRVSNRGENYANMFKSTIGFRLAL